APDRRQPQRAPEPGALLLRHPGLRLRAPFAGGRLGGPAGDGDRLGADGPTLARADLPAARGAARAGAAARGSRLAAAAAGRLALRPRAAPRRRAALRVGDRGAARQLLEPRHALRPRLRT